MVKDLVAEDTSAVVDNMVSDSTKEETVAEHVLEAQNEQPTESTLVAEETPVVATVDKESTVEAVKPAVEALKDDQQQQQEGVKPAEAEKLEEEETIRIGNERAQAILDEYFSSLKERLVSSWNDAYTTVEAKLSSMNTRQKIIWAAIASVLLLILLSILLLSTDRSIVAISQIKSLNDEPVPSVNNSSKKHGNDDDKPSHTTIHLSSKRTIGKLLREKALLIFGFLLSFALLGVTVYLIVRILTSPTPSPVPDPEDPVIVDPKPNPAEPEDPPVIIKLPPRFKWYVTFGCVWTVLSLMMAFNFSALGVPSPGAFVAILLVSFILGPVYLVAIVLAALFPGVVKYASDQLKTNPNMQSGWRRLAYQVLLYGMFVIAFPAMLIVCSVDWLYGVLTGRKSANKPPTVNPPADAVNPPDPTNPPTANPDPANPSTDPTNPAPTNPPDPTIPPGTNPPVTNPQLPPSKQENSRGEFTPLHELLDAAFK